MLLAVDSLRGGLAEGNRIYSVLPNIIEFYFSSYSVALNFTQFYFIFAQFCQIVLNISYSILHHFFNPVLLHFSFSFAKFYAILLPVWPLAGPFFLYPRHVCPAPTVSAGSAQGLFSTLTVFATLAPALIGNLASRPGATVGGSMLVVVAGAYLVSALLFASAAMSAEEEEGDGGAAADQP